MKMVMTAAHILTICNASSSQDGEEINSLVTLRLSFLLLYIAAGGIITSWRMLLEPLWRLWPIWEKQMAMPIEGKR